MQFYHSRDEVFKEIALEPRLLRREDGRLQEIYLEKRFWDAHDFITGRTYGHAYFTDERLMYWVERNMEDERHVSFDRSFQCMVAHIYHRLTGVALYSPQ